MGLVSDTEWERELGVTKRDESATQIKETQIKEIPTRGRRDGDLGVPDSLRKLIGEEALLNGRQEAVKLAKELGVSPSSVSAYSNGATSTKSYHSPAPSIISHINKTRARAVKRASKTLNEALGSITQEKLDYADAKDLSGIAKDMSVIIRNLEPPATENKGEEGRTGPQFIIYAPQFRKEESFDVIQVNE